MLHVFIMARLQSRRDWLERAVLVNPALHVAGMSSTFPFLRSLLNEKSADVIVVDVDSHSDVELARDWLQELLDLAPIVLFSPAPDPAIYNRIVRAAGGAILRTQATADQIVHAIEAASRGLITLDSSLVPEDVNMNRLSEGLTGRETEVLRLLAEGLVNREIANRLEISEHTIKFHIRSILGKLGASTRTEAVTRGIRAGLIDL